MIDHYDYMLKNFEAYNTGLTKSEFIELLNILESNGENYDTFYNAIFNGHTEFCGIWHNGGTWDTQKELFDTLRDFHLFIKTNDLRQHLIDKMEDILDESETLEDVQEYFLMELDDITTTTDGFVKRYNY